jgi:hypothetical protein
MNDNNTHVICNKCGKIMRVTWFVWINGIICIDVESCSCAYDRKMKKFNEELDMLI